MDRKEFFTALGITAASSAVLACVSCSKEGGSKPQVHGPTGVDFTLDLTAAANSELVAKGGFLSSNNVLIGHTLADAYIAVQLSCTHAQYPLIYQANLQKFYCRNHGSTFSESGAVLAAPASTSLTAYKTQLTGNSLRIFS